MSVWSAVKLNVSLPSPTLVDEHYKPQIIG